MVSPGELLDAVGLSVRRCVNGVDSVAVAYSGGLDSSIIAAVTSRYVDVECYVACTEGSYDDAHVTEAAAADGLAVGKVRIGEEDIRHLVRETSSALRTVDPVRVAYTIPLMAVVENCAERAILTGGVADELFGGYAKYTASMSPGRQMNIDLEKALNELELLKNHAIKTDKNLAAPFADDELVSLCRDIPVTDKVGPGGRKMILREAGRLLGLEAADRPKKAAQYSSGVSKLMRRCARDEGLSVGEWVREVAGPPSEGSNI